MALTPPLPPQNVNFLTSIFVCLSICQKIDLIKCKLWGRPPPHFGKSLHFEFFLFLGRFPKLNILLDKSRIIIIFSRSSFRCMVHWPKIELYGFHQNDQKYSKPATCPFRGLVGLYFSGGNMQRVSKCIQPYCPLGGIIAGGNLIWNLCYSCRNVKPSRQK